MQGEGRTISRAAAPPPTARGRAIVLAAVGLTASAASAGCAYLSDVDWERPLRWLYGEDAPAFVWDTLSPPPLDPAAGWTEPDPVPIGLPPEADRYHDAIDVLHYDVELVVPPEGDRIAARTVIRYLREGRGVHTVTVDLSGLAVEAVTARGVPIQFRQDPGLLRMVSPGMPGVYDTLQVEVMTRGTPDDGLIIGRNVHGEPTVFADNWPNRARFWFPSNDHPSDKATVSYTVHVPPAYSVIANGAQTGEPEPADPARTGGIEGLVTWRWGTRVPIPTYLMVVGIANLEVLDQGVAACGAAPASPRSDGCIEVTSWAFPPDTAFAREIFGRSGQMVDAFTDLFGPYLFEKLANVQASTRFGGMENASAIFYSEEAIAEGRDIEDTVAHEIAHQWFGDAVTPADWPHLWLSEGFATYFAAVFRERIEGPEAFQTRMARSRERYLTSDVVDRPVVDSTASNLLDLLNANSYDKGALVLHMLRWVVGDRTFFNQIRSYYQRHTGGNVVTADLQAAFDEVRGELLDWFFQQWLHSPGYPTYRVEWSWDERSQRARVSIVQDQPEDWPTFQMPVELEFQLAGGVHRVTEWVDGREWSVSVTLPSRPTRLRLDPDGWLLMRAFVSGPTDAAP